ncbi:MAG: hypothetical protein H6816_11485 [Phycisphaerales bacterium]|nr:hypothetical protein [Phycisphaerales bacterium]
MGLGDVGCDHVEELLDAALRVGEERFVVVEFEAEAVDVRERAAQGEAVDHGDRAEVVDDEVDRRLGGVPGDGDAISLDRGAQRRRLKLEVTRGLVLAADELAVRCGADAALGGVEVDGENLMSVMNSAKHTCIARRL